MSIVPYPHPILFRAQPMRPDDAPSRLDQAAALAAAGEGVLLAWGGLPFAGSPPPGVTLFALPPAWERQGQPGVMLDGDGVRADAAWKKRRAASLLALFAGMQPRLIVLDGAPSLFRFELRPLLEMARRRTPPPTIRLWPDGVGVGAELAGLVAG